MGIQPKVLSGAELERAQTVVDTAERVAKKAGEDLTKMAQVVENGSSSMTLLGQTERVAKIKADAVLVRKLEGTTAELHAQLTGKPTLGAQAGESVGLTK